MTKPLAAPLGLLTLLIVALFTSAVPQRADAAPLLYIYRGAGCTGLQALAQPESMLQRKVDGVVDFNDLNQGTTKALDDLNWQLGCWQKHGYKLSIRIGLAFKNVSTADVAAGKADDTYSAMGRALVAHGFADADVALGHEMNGGWYPWGRQATYPQAFRRIYKLLKATPGGHFTIIFNPTAGLDAAPYFPGVGAVDGMAWDVYASTWMSGGVKGEPGLFAGDVSSSWGLASIGDVVPGRGFYGQLPVAIPEFGVGSRGDGHGACAKTGANDCDDPYFLSHALAFFQQAHARYVGYWDYNAGDYNSEVSGGARPQEAGVMIQTFGAEKVKAFINSHSIANTPAKDAPTITCKLCHAGELQAGPGRWLFFVWVIQDHSDSVLGWNFPARRVQLYEPMQGDRPIATLPPGQSANLNLKGGHLMVLAVTR